MRTRWLLNLTLLGIILVLGLLVIYEPGLKKPIELPKLTDLEADRLNTCVWRGQKTLWTLRKMLKAIGKSRPL